MATGASMWGTHGRKQQVLREDFAKETSSPLHHPQLNHNTGQHTIHLCRPSSKRSATVKKERPILRDERKSHVGSEPSQASSCSPVVLYHIDEVMHGIYRLRCTDPSFSWIESKGRCQARCARCYATRGRCSKNAPPVFL